MDIDVAEANLTLGNLGGSIDLSGAKASGTLAAARFPALTGDVTTVAGLLGTTIAANAVSDTKLRDSAGLSVIGRSANTTGDPADIAAANDGEVLRRSGTTLGFGTLATAGLADNAVTNPKLADVPTATFKGRATAGTGDPEDLTATQATALLNAMVGDSGSGGTKGLAPAPAAGDAAANKFLKADGTWTVPPGGGGGSPGGSTTQVQYNNAGAFGGSADFTFDSATGEVTLGKWERLAEQASDPADPTNGIRIFSKALAGRRMPRYVAAKGMGSFLQASIATQKIAHWSAFGNSNAAMSAIGASATTNTGTLTARNVATTNILTRTRRLGFVSAATAGSAAGPRSGSAQWTVGNGSGLGGLFFCAIFNISDAAILAAGRMFIGMRASVAAPTDVEPSTLTDSFGVGCNSADTNLQICYGGSAAQTRIDLGANFPSDTTNTDLYRVCFFSSPSENGIVYYEVTRLNTGHVATGTLGPGTPGTTLPSNTTLLAPNFYRSNGGNATAVGIDVSQIYIETEQ